MELALKDDKLERYRDHLFLQEPLTDQESAMFQKYFAAFTQLCDGLSERQVVQMLMSPETYSLGQSQAYNIVRDAQALFGSTKTAKKDAKRQIYVTRMEELARKLELAGELEAAANVLAKAAKLQGLLEKDAPYVDPRQFLAMPNLIFTDDLAAIQINREIEEGEAEVLE